MYAPFAATERVLMALCKQGADRQEIHERLRIHALKAWDGVQRGKTNPLDKSISKDLEFQRYLSETALQNLMDVNNHLGDAPQRAREFAAALRREIEIRPEI
jgi:adenylosuccinate lyase